MKYANLFLCFALIGCSGSEETPGIEKTPSNPPAQPADAGGDPSPPPEVPTEDPVIPEEPIMPEPTPPEDHTSEIITILQAKCAPCHTGTRHAGGLSFSENFPGENPLAANTKCDGLTKAACVPVLIENGDMPMRAGCAENPENPKCVTADELVLIKAWVSGL